MISRDIHQGPQDEEWGKIGTETVWFTAVIGVFCLVGFLGVDLLWVSVLWDFLGGLSCYCLVAFWGFFLMKSSTASQDCKLETVLCTGAGDAYRALWRNGAKSWRYKNVTLKPLTQFFSGQECLIQFWVSQCISLSIENELLIFTVFKSTSLW